MNAILVTEFMDASAVGTLAARCPTAYEPALADDRAALLARVGAADALVVRNRTRVDAELLAAAPRLRVVGRLGVGLDNIDVAACAARGIAVLPATGANARSVAEYVVAAAMMLRRGCWFGTPEVAAGRWPRAALSEGREFAGCTLGLVGFGGIGRLTAQLAGALGARVIAHDPLLAADPAAAADARALGVEPRGLDAVFAEADVVSLHVPLTAGTRGLVDAARLATMKPDAVLVNTARGGIVDEAALAAALRERRLGGAALDVFDAEPLAAGSPLAGCPGLLLTPHVAGVTHDSNVAVSALIAERVLAALGAAPAGAAR